MNKVYIIEEDKIYIGVLVKHYRRAMYDKTKSSRWTQKGFIYDNYGTKICSEKTLGLIENGIPIKNDMIYEELLHKFNIKYDFTYSIHSINLSRCSKDLLLAIENYDSNTISDITKNIIRVLNKGFHNYVFFHEYLQFYMMIQDYYNSKKLLNANQISLIMNISNYIDSEMKEILIDLVCKTKFRNDDYDCSDINLESMHSSINKMNYILYLIHHNQILKTNRLLHDLCLTYKSSKNYIRLIDVFTIQLSLCTINDKDYFLELLDEILLFFYTNFDYIPSIKKVQTYKNIGVTAYKLQNYDIAEDFILKFINSDNREVLPYIVLLLDIYEKSNNKENILKILNLFKPDQSKYGTFFLYYQLKYLNAYNDVELTEFILTYVIKLLTSFDKIFISIFYAQIEELTKKTNRHKDFKIFISKLPKNVF